MISLFVVLPLSNVIRRTNRPNLDIIPSNIDLAAAEVELISKVGGQTRLRTKLGELGNSLGYDFVIIDAPPSLGFLTFNALAAADEVLIPVPASVFALKGIQRLEDTIALGARPIWGAQTCISAAYSAPSMKIPMWLKMCELKLKSTLVIWCFRTNIPKTIKFEESHGRTMSIFEYAPDSSGSSCVPRLSTGDTYTVSNTKRTGGLGGKIFTSPLVMASVVAAAVAEAG